MNAPQPRLGNTEDAYEAVFHALEDMRGSVSETLLGDVEEIERELEKLMALSAQKQGGNLLNQNVEWQIPDVAIPEDMLRKPAPKKRGLFSSLYNSVFPGIPAGPDQPVRIEEPASVIPKGANAPKTAGIVTSWAFAAGLTRAVAGTKLATPALWKPGFLPRLYGNGFSRIAARTGRVAPVQSSEPAPLEINNAGPQKAVLLAKWALAAGLMAGVVGGAGVATIQAIRSDMEKGASLDESLKNMANRHQNSFVMTKAAIAFVAQAAVNGASSIADSTASSLKSYGHSSIEAIERGIENAGTAVKDLLPGNKGTNGTPEAPPLIQADQHWRTKPADKTASTGTPQDHVDPNAVQTDQPQPPAADTDNAALQAPAMFDAAPVQTQSITPAPVANQPGVATTDSPVAGESTQEKSAAPVLKPSLKEQVADALGARSHSRKVMNLIEKAFEGHDSQAKKDLAKLFFYGQGGLTKDRTVAMGLYEEAAAAGNVQAKVDRAYFKYYGLGGLKADPKTAREEMIHLAKINPLARDLVSVWAGKSASLGANVPAPVRTDAGTGVSQKNTPPPSTSKSLKGAIATQENGPGGCTWHFNKKTGEPVEGRNCDASLFQGKTGQKFTIPFLMKINLN